MSPNKPVLVIRKSIETKDPTFLLVPLPATSHHGDGHLGHSLGRAQSYLFPVNV